MNEPRDAELRERIENEIDREAKADEEAEQAPRAVTILELAYFRLRIQSDQQGSLNGADFERVGLPIMGGCEVCHATVAAYNACPSKSGYLRCASGCIGDTGFATTEEANRFCFPDEYVWQGPKESTP